MRSFSKITLSKGFGTVGKLLKGAVEISTLTGRDVDWEFNGVLVTVNQYTEDQYASLILKAVQEQRKFVGIRG